jgi:hypothetical protein
MTPMTVFFKKIDLNKKAYLRIYEEDEEVKRIEQYNQEKNQILN